jgi:hypothetical protein
MAKASSAVPANLHRYSRSGLDMDSALWYGASALQTTVERFESRCTEYRVPIRHHADDLRRFSSSSLDLDFLAKRTAEGFERADSAFALGIIRPRSVAVRDGALVQHARALILRLGLSRATGDSRQPVSLIRRLRFMLWWRAQKPWAKGGIVVASALFSGAVWPARVVARAGSGTWGVPLWPPRVAQGVWYVASLVAGAARRIAAGIGDRLAGYLEGVIGFFKGLMPDRGARVPEQPSPEPDEPTESGFGRIIGGPAGDKAGRNALPEKMKAIVDELLETFVDVDHKYGNQCVDLVVKLRPDLPTGKGYAKNYMGMATRISADGQPVPKPGDVLVWDARAGVPPDKVSDSGHVAIVESVNPDGRTVNIVEQNFPTGAPVRRRKNVELTSGMGFIPYEGSET